MSDDIIEDAGPDAGKKPKKKGGMKKLLLLIGVPLVLAGGGAAGGLYAAKAGLIGGGDHADAAEAHGPKLVPKSEQKHPGEGGEGGGGHGGGGEEGAHEAVGIKPPAGKGGDQYASNYYAMEKDFTANLQDSVHFVQVGIAVSTPYDDTVIDNIKTNEFAVRSAVLLALGDTTEDQVFTSAGKLDLQRRLAKAINATLQQKEGFGGVSNVYFTNFVVQ